MREAEFSIRRVPDDHPDPGTRRYPYYYRVKRSGKPLGEVWQTTAKLRKFYRHGKKAAPPDTVLLFKDSGAQGSGYDAAAAVYWLILESAFDATTARDWALAISKLASMPIGGSIVTLRASDLFDRILEEREKKITSPTTPRA